MYAQAPVESFASSLSTVAHVSPWASSPWSHGPSRTAEVAAYTRAVAAIPGSCLCGGVRFEVTPPFERSSHCHCSRCRKHSGNFGATSLRANAGAIRFLSGKELLGAWAEEGFGTKVFCTRCGSSLFGGAWPDGEISVRFGALDADPGIRPQRRIHVDSAAPWFDVPDDGLPRFGGRAPRTA